MFGLRARIFRPMLAGALIAVSSVPAWTAAADQPVAIAPIPPPAAVAQYAAPRTQGAKTAISLHQPAHLANATGKAAAARKRRAVDDARIARDRRIARRAQHKPRHVINRAEAQALHPIAPTRSPPPLPQRRDYAGDMLPYFTGDEPPPLPPPPYAYYPAPWRRGPAPW